MLPSLARLSLAPPIGVTTPGGVPRKRKPGVFSRAWLFKHFQDFVVKKWEGDPPDVSKLAWNRLDDFKRPLSVHAKKKLDELLAEAKQHATSLFPEKLDPPPTSRKDESAGEEAEVLAKKFGKEFGSQVEAKLRQNLNADWGDDVASFEDAPAASTSAEPAKDDPLTWPPYEQASEELRKELVPFSFAELTAWMRAAPGFHHGPSPVAHKLGPDGPLSETDLQTRIAEAKVAMRKQLYEDKVAAAKQKAKTKLLAEGSDKQKARFVCRLVFGKEWYASPRSDELDAPLPGGGTPRQRVKDMGLKPDVESDLKEARKRTKDARLAWAAEVVAAAADPVSLFFDNPPPPQFYSAGKLGSIDIWLRDYAPSAGGMPAFAGPTNGLRASGSAPDGLDVLLYIYRRKREFVPPPAASAYAGTAVERFKEPFLKENAGKPIAAQDAALRPVYAQLVQDLTDFKIDLTQQLGLDEKIVEKYTQGAGSFNRALRLQLADPAPPADDPVARRAFVANLVTKVRQEFNSPQETVSEEAFISRALGRMHKLWRTIQFAPRAPVDCVFLRATTGPEFIPGGYQSANVGRTFFEPSFISATSAPPSVYVDLDNVMSTFFDGGDSCCIAVLSVKAGTPMLPIWFTPGASAYGDSEREVIIAPCTLWTFEGKEFQAVAEPDSAIREVLVAHFTVRSAFE